MGGRGIMATSTPVDTMMVVAVLVAIYDFADGKARDYADADHADDDDGVLASVMMIWKGVRHARAAE
eukprot:9073475-Pyramimonas_sp.AAC.1